jgi:hypothetical protein
MAAAPSAELSVMLLQVPFPAAGSQRTNGRRGSAPDSAGSGNVGRNRGAWPSIQKPIEESIMADPIPGTPEPLPPETIIERLREIRAGLAGFQQLPLTVRKSMRTLANASPAFVQAAINTLGAAPEVVTIVRSTADELQQLVADAASWSAVEDEMRAVLAGVAAANLTRRHRIGTLAVQTYAVTKRAIRQSEHSSLISHVDEMRRLNRFGRKRAKAEPIPVPEQ